MSMSSTAKDNRRDSDVDKHVQSVTATAAVIVTHNRVDALRKSIGRVINQTHRPQWLIVVDNGDDPEVKKLAEAACAGAADRSTEGITAPELRYIGSKTNLGGAGGFALGMLTALSVGADWIWCADDDGRPEDFKVLAALHACAARHHLDAVSPIVADIHAPDRLAFPLRRGLTWRRKRNELFENGENPKLPHVVDDQGEEWFTGFGSQSAATGYKLPPHITHVDPDHDLLPGIASLFNGALFSAKALERIGVPDYRLFIRGDEVEFHRRLARSGLRFGTCLTTAYLHPSGSDEFKPILGGAMHTQYPADDFKRYFTYRNRGYLMSQPGMRKLLPQEFLRFGYFFLVQQRDVGGFYKWFKLLRKGRAENFERFEPNRE